jgi:hypothetical protein
MKVFVDQLFDSPVPRVEEESIERAGFMELLLADANRQEALYLSEIAKAEAGETILDLYNNLIDVQLYPDGRVILEELRYSAEDEAKNGPPARIEITLAEAKQLIEDWLAAKNAWKAQRAAAKAAPTVQAETASAISDSSAASPTDSKVLP